MAQYKYRNNQRVKGGVLKRSRRRQAALALSGKLPSNLRGRSYTGRQARRLKKLAGGLPKTKSKNVRPGSGLDKRTRSRYESIPDIPGVNLDNGTTRKEAKKVKRGWRRAGRPRPFDPSKPLTGKDFAEELKARETLEFGDRERELDQATANQRQTEANTGTYMDDYRQALRESAARIKETNRQKDEANQAHVDTAFNQDSQASAARDAEASEQATKLGRGPVQTVEGQQAAEAARSQGNQSTARGRQSSADDSSLMEKRGSTAVLAKAEALAREQARARRLREERRSLEKEEGAARVGYRSDARKSEREWMAIQEEFGLKNKQINADIKQGRADNRTERMKANAQKIVARIYASADKAGARAQVRVAKLQLQKGKISKHQYQTIRNVYEGLPGGGPGNKGNGGGQWGGPVDTPAEHQKSDQMFADLMSRKPDPSKRRQIIQGAVRNGVPRAAAIRAWRRYMKKHYPHRGSATPRNPDGTPG